MMCLHCRKRSARERPRGLCCFCYGDPFIRAAYPFGGNQNFGRKGVGSDIGGGYAQPAEASEALPGTEDKMLEMQRRAAQGVSLFHQRDARRSAE